MKIALLALHFAEYASRLALALAARHEVLLVLRADNAQSELTPDLRRQLEAAVKVQYLEGRRWRDPRVVGASLLLNGMVRRFKPDVVHLQEVHPLLVGYTVVSFRKVLPVVITVHDPVSHSGGPPKEALLWKSLMWVRRRASRLLVHGPQMRNEMEKLDSGLTGRVDVVPHGILAEPAPLDAPHPCEPETFLFFGRMEPYKGLRYLLDACDILHARGHRFRLVIAGTGPDLEVHAQRIAASPHIELINKYIPAGEVGALFRRASAVVLPYTDATQSGVAAIALANSRPVIATATGDLTEIVLHGRSGLIVPPCNEEALANAMGQLLVDGPLRDSLAEGAGRQAREKLCWSRVADLTLETYVRAGAPSPAQPAVQSTVLPSMERRSGSAPDQATHRRRTA
ncbi:MAG: glycosyltransferase family 4 protein [Pseudomonadota bacterium]|nr:glycosyltransferase family 4 protein [Pseudomonadota bacterium]